MKILLVNRALYPRATAGMVMLRLADALRELGHEIIFLVQEDLRNLDRPDDKVIAVNPTDTRSLTTRRSRKYFLDDPGINAAVTELVNTEHPDVALVFHVTGSLTWSVPMTLRSRNVPVFMMETDFSRCCPAGRFSRSTGNWLGGVHFPRPFNLYIPHHEEKPCMRCMKRLPLHSAQRRSAIPFFSKIFYGSHWCLLCRCADPNYYKNLDAWRSERYLRRSKLIREVSGWMTTSHHHALLVEAAIKPRRNVQDIGLPLPEEAFDPLPTKRGNYVLYIGSLSQRHGALDLMAALQKMEANSKLNAIFSGAGPERVFLQSNAKQMMDAHKNHISFPGTLPIVALRRLIADSLAVVIPSHCEEIAPWPLLEAQALGKPVIVSDCGVLPERVDSSINGLVYACGDVDELCKCLQLISEMTQEKYDELCAASAEKAQFYHPLNYARRVLKFIEDSTGIV